MKEYLGRQALVMNKQGDMIANGMVMPESHFDTVGNPAYSVSTFKFSQNDVLHVWDSGMMVFVFVDWEQS